MYGHVSVCLQHRVSLFILCLIIGPSQNLTPNSILVHSLCVSYTLSNYVAKDQYFRNQNDTELDRKERAKNTAECNMNKSLNTAGLFFDVLVENALERRADGRIAKSTSVESISKWARNVAEDKRAKLMIRDRFEYDALEHIRDEIRAVQHPNGSTWTSDGDLRQKSQQAKTRSNNTGLVGTEKFHGMYHDDIPPPPPIKDSGREIDSDRSTPTSITESATSSTASNKRSDALVATLEEAYLQLGLLSSEQNDQSGDRIDFLTEVISRIDQQDSLIIGTNEAMAKNNRTVKERLDSLIGIVMRQMKKRAGTM